MAKVWKVLRLPNTDYSFKPREPKPYEPKTFYSLFAKINGKYVQVSNAHYASMSLAAKVFAHRIAADMTLSIRECNIKPNSAEGTTHFTRATYKDYKYDRSNWEYGVRK